MATSELQLTYNTRGRRQANIIIDELKTGMAEQGYTDEAGAELAGATLETTRKVFPYEYLKPPKKRIGIADGKYKMPPDDLLFYDEIVPEWIEKDYTA